MTEAVKKARDEMRERIAESDPDLAQQASDARSLEEALDFDFTGWNPKAGDKLVGTVVYTTRTDGGHPEFEQNTPDGKYPLVATITTDGELIAVHAFHSVLRNAIEGQAPQRGDRIAIKYKGRKTEGGRLGTGYEDYNVIVVKAESAPTGTPALASGS